MHKINYFKLSYKKYIKKNEVQKYGNYIFKSYPIYITTKYVITARLLFPNISFIR